MWYSYLSGQAIRKDGCASGELRTACSSCFLQNTVVDFLTGYASTQGYVQEGHPRMPPRKKMAHQRRVMSIRFKRFFNLCSGGSYALCYFHPSTCS